MSETKTHEERSNKDILTEHLNSFKKQAIDFALDLKRHLVIQEENPQYQKPMQNGQYKSIDELIKEYRAGLENAQSYVATIEELLKAEEAGTLQNTIDSYKLIKSPISGKDDDGKEENTEEAKA